jgi:hypothetical protein
MYAMFAVYAMYAMYGNALSVKVKRKVVEEDKSAAHDADATTTGD